MTSMAPFLVRPGGRIAFNQRQWCAYKARTEAVQATVDHLRPDLLTRLVYKLRELRSVT